MRVDQQSHSIAEVCACKLMLYLAILHVQRIYSFAALHPTSPFLQWASVTGTSIIKLPSPRISLVLTSLFCARLSSLYSPCLPTRRLSLRVLRRETCGLLKMKQVGVCSPSGLLEQQLTLSDSPLGTCDFGYLSHYLTDNPMPQGKPWAARTAKVSFGEVGWQCSATRVC